MFQAVESGIEVWRSGRYGKGEISEGSRIGVGKAFEGQDQLGRGSAG